MKSITLEIPYWAGDEQEQEYILLLAFLYKLGQAYGHSNLFLVYDSDIRIILGKTQISPIFEIAGKPWINRIQIGQALNDKSSFKLKFADPNRYDVKRAVEVELTDHRCIAIWLYLLGAFCNNLIEQQGRKKRMGVDRVLKHKLLHGE